MSSEPERPIEKLLRGCAKQKREQAGQGWEMHPATRRLLQQEVSRRFGRQPQPSPQRPRGLLGLAWLRPLPIAGALALVTLIVWIAVQAVAARKSQSLLAKNEAPQSLTPPSSSVTTLAEKVALSRSESEKRADAADNAEVAKQIVLDDGAREKLKEAAGASRQLAAKDLPKPVANPVAAAQSTGSAALFQDRDEKKAIEPQTDLGAVVPLRRAQADSPPQRYGLQNGLQQTPPALPATPLATSPEQETAMLTTLGKVAPGLALPAVAEAQSNLVGVPLAVADAPKAGIVQYGYFAASQFLSPNSRARQQIGGAALAGSRSAAPQAGQAANQILVSFRVEQSGRELRIIDKDDSVYVGPLQGPSATAAGLNVADQVELARTYLSANTPAQPGDLRNSKTAQQASTKYLFQVVGTNRSSNQRVVFSGALSLDTNALGQVTAQTVERLKRQDQADKPLNFSASPPVSPTDLPGLRLSGKALIGADQEVQIEAVPASPQRQGQ